MISASSDRIFFGGFASGLDTNALIDALIAVQGRPIALSANRRIGIERRRDTLAQINSSLANLLARLADLEDSSIVGARRASADQTFGEPSKLTVSAAAAAAVGSFTVDIVSLATPTDVQSTAAVGQAVSQGSPLDQAGFDIPIVAGTFTIDSTEFTIPAATASTAESASAAGSGVSLTATLDSAGLTIAPDATGTFDINGYQISYAAAADSLNDIIQRINSSSAGVTASYDAGADRLLLTSDTTGSTLITFSDTTGNFFQAMNFVDAVPVAIATELAGSDLISLTAVVTMINAAAIGVTASIANDSDARANLLQLSSASNIQLGSAGDTSTFLSVAHMLESPQGTTRTSVRNLGALSTATALEDARMQTALSQSTGSFEINGVSISYDEAADSLNNIITRINESDAGVTATYDVQTDTFFITADGTGSLSIGLADTGGNFLAAMGMLAATQTLGANASYRIDGGALQYSTSSTVSNAVTGVTLTFRDATTSAITVTVSTDTGQLRGKLEDFVEQYNSTLTLTRDATRFVDSGDSGDSGVLLGDSGLLNLMRNLRSRVTGVATGMSGDISTLASIGFNFGAVGSAIGNTELLLFNSSTFDSAITDNPEAVSQLLTGFSASASLEAGGDGSVASITGTPTTVRDSGVYELTSATGGALTMTFKADDGSPLVVTTVTISPGEVNTTLIPGLTITFSNPLLAGVDQIKIAAVQEGIAKSLHEYVDSFARSGGVMEARSTEMQARIDDINDQIERMETRLDAKREQLIRKFARLEVVMQRLNNQQAALTALVGQLRANRRTS